MTGVEMLNICARRCRDSIAIIEDKVRGGYMLQEEADDHLARLRELERTFESHAQILFERLMYLHSLTGQKVTMQ